MTVLHFTTDDVHKSALVKTSDRLLRLKNRVADYCNDVLDNPSFRQLHRDFDYLCDKLADDFKDLESVVNAAVLKLLVETFMETHEPLDRLIKAAMLSSSSTVAAEEEKENHRRRSTAPTPTPVADFEEYVEDFCLHAEALGKFEVAPGEFARRFARLTKFTLSRSPSFLKMGSGESLELPVVGPQDYI